MSEPRGAWRRVAAWLRRAAWVASAVGAAGAPAAADAPAPQWRTFPFAQQLDMALVRAVTGSPPAALVAAIDRTGVDVRVVRSPATQRPPNPLLATLPPAPPALLEAAEFRESTEGKIVFRGAPCCGLARDTLIVRDTATTYTLLHEFVQSRLVPVGGVPLDPGLELRFATDFRRLVTYQQRLNDDPTRLLDPLWRRDILAAQAAVADGLYARIQMGQSQEAIVEKVLCCEIAEDSPYFDAERRAEGLRYGELMIDNAIDLYNTLLASVRFVEATVLALHDELHGAQRVLAPPQRLTDADVDAVTASLRRTDARLAPVRAELLALKAFYRD